jgi:membrane-associated phospholipid phosphatase
VRAYDGLMQLGILQRVSCREPVQQRLLPRRLRLSATALLAVCATGTAVLGAHFADLNTWLDSTIDPRIQTQLGRFPEPLSWLPDFGTLRSVTLMTLALVFACVATRRWAGAVLAAVAAPTATGLTEYVLKPDVGRAIGQSFPSGHATSMFALAAVCAVLLVDPPRRRVPEVVRLTLVLMALLLATAVAAAMVAIGAHYFTDAVAGAAVGTGVVLVCTLTLDLVTDRARQALVPQSIPDV